MSATMLSIAQAVVSETGFGIPTSISSTTDASQIQLRNLLQSQARSLRNKLVFPNQKKVATVILQAGREFYPFQQDYYSATTDTAWDDTRTMRLIGPLSDARYTDRTRGKRGINNNAYRVFGPDANVNSTRGQLQIVPKPSSSGEELSYEYITKNLFVPPDWVPGAHYSGGVATAYVNLNGNNYFTNTTGNAGSFPFSVDGNGQGQDGGVFWTYLPLATFVSNSIYAAGTYLAQGGTLYHCVIGGKSGVSGPTGTGSKIIDGTVTWESCAITTWAAYTSFAVGTFTLVSGKYYLCTTPDGNTYLSGAAGPTWDGLTQSDGGITWAINQAPYETILTDKDMCLFDDDIMQAGLKWRYAKAKKLEWQNDFNEYTSMLARAVGRWKGSFRGSLGNPRTYGPRYTTPDGGWKFN